MLSNHSAPGAPPQAVAGQPLSPTSVLVKWKPPPPDQRNGNIKGYKVFYVKNDDGVTEKDAQVLEVPHNKLEATIDKLAIWTQYKLWVVAFTAAGDGPLSPPIILTTAESGRYKWQ